MREKKRRSFCVSFLLAEEAQRQRQAGLFLLVRSNGVLPACEQAIPDAERMGPAMLPGCGALDGVCAVCQPAEQPLVRRAEFPPGELQRYRDRVLAWHVRPAQRTCAPLAGCFR